MLHTNGFLRSIISDKWLVETKATHFTYRNRSTSGQIEFYDIHSVRRNVGIISDEVLVTSNNSLLKITGFSAADAGNLIHDIEAHVKKCVIDLVILARLN